MNAGSRLQSRLAEWHQALHHALSAPEDNQDLLAPHWQALEVQAGRLSEFVAAAPCPVEYCPEGGLCTVVSAEPRVQLVLREALVQIESALIK